MSKENYKIKNGNIRDSVAQVSHGNSSMSAHAGQINHGEQYDAYYGGHKSIYDKLYGGKVISRDKWVIKEIARKCLSKVKEDSNGERVLRILDYGCGDGRYLQAILPIAEYLKSNSNVKVEVIAYDPSRAGLEKFETNLGSLGFIKDSERSHGYHDIASQPGGTEGYLSNTLKSDKFNLSVKLVHGHVFDSPSHIKSIIGSDPVHMGICMYGVLSHVPMQKERIKLLKMLGDVVQEKLLLTLPSYRILQEQKKTYDYLRQERHINTLPKDVQERGNVHYTRRETYNKDGLHGAQEETLVENSYHLYGSPEEIMFELGAAKLKGNVRVQKILHETTLTQYPSLAVADEWVSSAVPKSLSPYLAGYYLVTAWRPKELRQEQSALKRHLNKFDGNAAKSIGSKL